MIEWAGLAGMSSVADTGSVLPAILTTNISRFTNA
jgi:hypothetical protein